MATEKDKLQADKLEAIFDSFLRNHGMVSVAYIMNHNPGLFKSKQDCVRFLQDLDRPPLEYWHHDGKSPSIWRLTAAGRAFAEELSRRRRLGRKSS